jgi:STE24 endopeptidase
MKKAWLLLEMLVLILSTGSVLTAQILHADPAGVQKAQSSSNLTPSLEVVSSQVVQQKVTAYTLPPARHKKAHDLSRIHFRYTLISFVYSLLVLWLVLRWKLGATYRTWAEKASAGRFLQALIFSPLLILTIDILELPTGIYENWISRQYGLSVQGWGSWIRDWAKGEIIAIIIGSLLIWGLYTAMHGSPRRWWLYSWLVSLPIAVFLIFLQPLIVDPIFHKFEPLAKKDAALTVSLVKMVQRAGQNILPERMFWMGAGEKTTALNAYVTGVGSSKRIVVWDTTIAKMTTPQITFVAGHEMGHYVLQHIPKGLGLTAVLLFVFFYIGFRTIVWVLAHWGGYWGVRGVDDFASLPTLLLLLSVLAFIASPVINGVSRHFEHQADIYGLEVTHGLTPDSGQVAAQAFQVMGDVDLADPNPNPAHVFLFYSHPPVPDRIQFSLTYDPWSQGKKRNSCISRVQEDVWSIRSRADRMESGPSKPVRAIMPTAVDVAHNGNTIIYARVQTEVRVSRSSAESAEQHSPGRKPWDQE